MALHWNLSKIHNYETMCWIETEDGRRLSHRTEGLIFMTMAVGIGKLDDTTIPEFWARVELIERLFGADCVTGKGQPAPYTLEEVIAHNGLVCNVSTETRTKWMNRIVKDHLDAQVRVAKSALAKQKADMTIAMES